jgi:putative addiction module CopG family antidote
MDVSLTRSLEKFVAAKVKTGAYSSPSAVVRAALHLLQKIDQRQAEWHATNRLRSSIAARDLEKNKVVRQALDLLQEMSRSSALDPEQRAWLAALKRDDEAMRNRLPDRPRRAHANSAKQSRAGKRKSNSRATAAMT